MFACMFKSATARCVKWHRAASLKSSQLETFTTAQHAFFSSSSSSLTPNPFWHLLLCSATISLLNSHVMKQHLSLRRLSSRSSELKSHCCSSHNCIRCQASELRPLYGKHRVSSHSSKSDVLIQAHIWAHRKLYPNNIKFSAPRIQRRLELAEFDMKVFLNRCVLKLIPFS